MDKTNTPDEVIDLVDKNNHIIGETTKGEANNDPKLLHREIAILIYDDKNRVLLQQRSLKKKVYPGYWDITCAGHIPKGVKPIKAAHDELKEELGFNTKLKYIYTELLKFPNEVHFCYFYMGKFPKNAKLKIYKDEVNEARFFTPKEFRKLKKMIGYSLEDVENFWSGKYIEL